MRITKGDLVLLSANEYSDYDILDTFRAKKDFDTYEPVREFMSKYPEDEDGGGYRPDYEDFQEWVVSAGFVEELTTVEWHIGDYGRFNSD